MSPAAFADPDRNDDRLVAFWVPMQQKSLLVPQVAIAEVVTGGELAVPQSGAPPWLLGKLDWRGLTVPVLSYEIANGQTLAPDSPGARLAVFNAIGEQSEARFFALRIQGIPRTLRLSEPEVRADSLAKPGSAERLAVITQLGKASIPDLEYLESLVARLD